MLLLSFDLCRVSIQGKPWDPKNPALPGTFQIHQQGSACAFRYSVTVSVVLTVNGRLFVRLVGIKPAPESEDTETDHVVAEEPCAPTFNMQDELVSVHVSLNRGLF